MCGIFGIVVKSRSDFSPAVLQRVVNDLFRLSESRGKEASGVAVFSGDTIRIYKDAVPASTLIRSGQYNKVMNRALRGDISLSGDEKNACPLVVIGHSRLVTGGAQEIHRNNQPVIACGTVGIHNGIIVNVQELWESFPSLERECDVDTEVLLRLVQKFKEESGSSIRAVRKTFSLIQGAASVAILFDDRDSLLLATNSGSLYVCESRADTIFMFASEKHIMESLCRKRYVKRLLGEHRISWIKPGYGCLVGIIDLKRFKFSLVKDSKERCDDVGSGRGAPRAIVDIMPRGSRDRESGKKPAVTSRVLVDKISGRFPIDEKAINSLRRCTRCILPKTMPFIRFNDEGVCNYCRGYRKLRIKGEGALREAVAPYQSGAGEPDCIVPISGGRDSTYCLHYVKNVLNMRPIAYTYDWGMVTDLARRNISRICGKLGIEHILISADIIKKRMYIRKNVEAWLKRPDLGMIPLFMAGDKPYFYYIHKLRKQTGVKLAAYSENRLERTGFKTGFCGVIEETGESYYAIPLIRKMKIAAYYARQCIMNPAYLNSSIFDNLFGFLSAYTMRHDYLFFDDYIRWNEDAIVSLLRKEYDWEVDPGTATTWRIGDGTAAFYNYIYYTVAGFTENDTLRSNQVREGIISRERALALAREDNRPRYKSIQWYCNTIGVDFNRVMRRINEIPRLY